MTMFEHITNLLGVVLWPALAGMFLLYFRKPISTIIGSIGSSIEKSERGSVGVGNFKLDWGKAEEQMVEAIEKSERSSRIRGTGDGTSPVPSAPPPSPSDPATAAPGGHGVDIGAGVGAETEAGSGSDSGDEFDLDDLLDEEEAADEEVTAPPAASSAPEPVGAPGPQPSMPEFSNIGSTLSDIAQRVGWQPIRITRSDRESALQRAQRAAGRLDGLRILWVDDTPQQQTEERRLFRTMGITVTAVEQHGEAMDALARGDFDLVISDMRRGEDQRAGIRFLEQLRSKGFLQPVVFYVGHLDPTMGVPPFAFGITNRPDDLLHFIIEVAERRA